MRFEISVEELNGKLADFLTAGDVKLGEATMLKYPWEFLYKDTKFHFKYIILLLGFDIHTAIPCILHTCG